MGYSALFKAVKFAKGHGRPIRLCNMHEDVRVGAEAVNLPLVVEIHESAAAALEAFGRG
jgi:anti-anti-sigma regulatory factor